MKRKTTKHRRPSRQSVLEVRVMSPRIAWFGFLKVAGKFTKLACVLAALAGIGWGVWRGIQHAFYQNPDFRLQVLDLNANPVIDELGVAAAAGIDLTANPSLFDVDVKEAERKLNKLPEITNARVERHLPGTLVVRVIPAARKPGFPVPRPATRMSAAPEPCWSIMTASPIHARSASCETASALPIIELPPSADHPIQAGRKSNNPSWSIVSCSWTRARRPIRMPSSGSN